LVKKLFLAIFLFNIAFADLLDEKVKSLVDKETYLTHQKLIDIIFRDKQKFYKTSDEIDIIEVVRYLQESGLLRLSFDEPKELFLTLKTDQNPIFFLKLIKNSLNSMGYYYFLTKEAVKDATIFTWKLSIKTEYAVNPIIFAKELMKRECRVLDISRNSQTDWEYVIDISRAKVMEAKELTSSLKLSKSINDYWLDINGLRGDLNIRSKGGNSWYPYIAFYNKNLELLGMYKRDDKIISSLNIKIPNECRYVKISDIYSLSNIKNGFLIDLNH
jgi:hypothetical protein